MSANSIFQICLGVFLILVGTIRLIVSANFLIGAESVFLGLGILLYELASYAKDKTKKGRVFTYTGLISLILGFILLVYNTFFY